MGSRNLTLTLSLLAVCAGALATPIAAQAQEAPKWADDLLDQWYVSFNAGDVEAVARLYSTDAVVGQDVKGRDAIKESLAASFAKEDYDCSGGFDGFQEVAGVAVGWGHDACTVTPKSGGPSESRKSRWLAVYEQQPDGSWLTVRDVWEEVSP